MNGRSVTWYSCGPTVYDASHMGHARCVHVHVQCTIRCIHVHVFLPIPTGRIWHLILFVV